MPDNSNRPPINPEQWLDFVIAAPAHRSHNEGHCEFGKALIQRYFSVVPERYQNDPAAAAYFDEMLCAVASAIRAMSVVRDVFETNWQALKAARDRELQNAEIWSMFSPFKKDGYCGKAVAILVSLGIGGVLLRVLKTFFANAALLWVVVIAVAIIIGLFGTEVFMQRQRSRSLRDCEARFPNDLLAFWEERSLGGYRKVAAWFLPLAFQISERYYPTDDQIPQESELEAMVDQHFVFRSRQKTPQ